jgi:hypothetical protein
METKNQASAPSEQAVVEKKPNQEIRGEVFITTQAGDTKRISGELVKFYQREQLEKSIEQSSKTAPNAMPPYDSEIAKVDQQIKEINQSTADAPFSQAIVDSKVRMLRLTDELKTLWTNLKTSWPHASYYFEQFPKPEFETRTDSDGKFSIELPEGNWIMVAETSRKVGASDEWYYWAYPVKSSSGNILSNFNLVTSGDADSLLKTKVARGEMPSNN